MKKRFIVKRAKKLSYLIINDLNHPLLQDCCDLHFTSPLDITIDIIFFTKILMILLKEVMIIMVIVAIFINVTILK